MKNFKHKLTALFPTGKTWLSLPAFTGWLSLSLGIILASRLPLSPVTPLYNDFFPYAIFFFLFFALTCRSLKIRNFFFFIMGFFLFTSQIQKEHIFYSSLNRISGTANKEIISGRLISAPLLSKGKYTFLVATDVIYSNSDTLKMHNKILKCKGKIPPPSYGAITCLGHYSPPRPPANPYAFNEYSYLLANRIWGRFNVDSLIKTSPATSFASHIAQSARATVIKTISHVNDVSVRGILQAAFLGEKNTLTTATKSVFREAGIYHLLAISGLHVAILISSILLILTIFPISRVIKTVLTIMFIWCYLFFIGFIPSLFRAVVMATLILLSTIFQRNNYVINSLGIAGIIWLVMSPTSIFTPGFQLSFAATFGIITLFPVFNNHLMPSLENPVAHLIIKSILTPFFISFAGFIATMPILIYHFGRISIFGLVANIFAVLLMGIAMNTFFVGIAVQLLWEPLSVIAMRITEFFLSLIIGTAELSRFFSWSSIQVPVPYTEFFIIYCVIFLGLAMIDKKYLLRYIGWTFSFIFLTIPVIILCHNSCSYSEIIFFSTKEGSLTGIRFPNRKIWLVGSAPEHSYNRPYRNAVEPWLRHSMIKDFDAILLPVISQNVVHDLDPILADNIPKSIIICNKPKNETLQEDFHSFLRNYNVNCIEAKNRWQFIPAKQCTCTIYTQEYGGKWYEKSKPALLKFSFGDTHIFINTANIVPPNTNSENDIVRINDDIAFCTNLKLNPKYLKYNGTQNSAISFSTESDGAVIIRINNKGIVKIKNMVKEN